MGSSGSKTSKVNKQSPPLGMASKAKKNQKKKDNGLVSSVDVPTLFSYETDTSLAATAGPSSSSNAHPGLSFLEHLEGLGDSDLELDDPWEGLGDSDFLGMASLGLGGPWDPLADADKTPPTAAALRRIQKELANHFTEQIEGIHFVLDDEKANIIHALVIGPPDTPYEGGFFYFLLRIPPTYPFKPPMVKLMTTGNGLVRFNPNLYNCGKVCLSILGTWPGPAWTPNLNIRTVLLSIQSLLSKEPYFNEPGFEVSKGTASGKKASEQYNNEIQYETMRVAVLGMMEEGNLDSSHMPQALKDIMKGIFQTKVDYYTAVLLQNENGGKNYGKLQERLNKLVRCEFVNSTADEDGPKPAKKAKRS